MFCILSDLCGIISNTTFAESPEDSCKMLMEINMVKTCVPAKTNATGMCFLRFVFKFDYCFYFISELPNDAEQLEMFLSPKSKVAVQKVDCSYLTA